jgi:hypothetical protein
MMACQRHSSLLEREKVAEEETVVGLGAEVTGVARVAAAMAAETAAVEKVGAMGVAAATRVALD